MLHVEIRSKYILSKLTLKNGFYGTGVEDGPWVILCFISRNEVDRYVHQLKKRKRGRPVRSVSSENCGMNTSFHKKIKVVLTPTSALEQYLRRKHASLGI